MASYDYYTDINDVYNRLDVPKFYYAKKYEDGSCVSSQVFQAKTAYLDSGYNVIGYYKVLTDGMIPTVEELFKKVYNGIATIGASRTLMVDNKTVREYFDSFKRLENFFYDNCYIYSIDPSTGNSRLNLSDVTNTGEGYVEKEKDPYTGYSVKIKLDDSLRLNEYCLKTLSFDDEIIIGNYNSYQEEINNRKYQEALSYKSRQEEPEKWKVTESSAGDISSINDILKNDTEDYMP